MFNGEIWPILEQPQYITLYNTFHSHPPLLPSKHTHSTSPRQATIGNLVRFPPDILNLGARESWEH